MDRNLGTIAGEVKSSRKSVNRSWLEIQVMGNFFRSTLHGFIFGVGFVSLIMQDVNIPDISDVVPVVPFIVAARVYIPSKSSYSYSHIIKQKYYNLARFFSIASGFSSGEVCSMLLSSYYLLK